ncbi:MAG TPA: arginine--tRNA ligase [Candidatus Saccharimonadales bacterium]|nr:arginine--tRNA ligase [Candidatus Saccharimonadales bacterium]
MSYLLEQTTAAIAAKAQEVLGVSGLPLVEPANPKFGADLAIPTFTFARELGRSPQEIATQLAEGLQHEAIAKAEAVSGFVNIWLSNGVIAEAMKQVNTTFGQHDTYAGKQVVIEHTDPNPFKEFHIGHTYTNTIGEAMGRLYKAGGADVHQVLYSGDVGMHVAKAIWGIIDFMKTGDDAWFDPEVNPAERSMANVLAEKRVAFLGAAYVHGATQFEESEVHQEEIKTINKHIYEHDDELVDEIRDEGKVWSFEYFDDIFARLQVSFERLYPESEVTDEGIAVVKNNMGKVFEESDGAVVFKGEKADLHTRVFINNRGLPTYEAKDLGLIYAKQRDYPDMDISHVITGNEQHVYYLVVIAAMNEIDATLAAKMRHTGHGLVKLRGGRKMSSRRGEVLRGVEVLDQLEEMIAEGYETEEVRAVALAALKYAYLKPRVGGDVIFDLEESINMEGDSGPYVQYAHARGRSILSKLDGFEPVELKDLTEDEHKLAVKILGYPAATAKAVAELAPHYTCAYLYELTQQFNRFYEHNRIVGDERQDVRATLVLAYVEVLKNGLELLNIPAPHKL